MARVSLGRTASASMAVALVIGLAACSQEPDPVALPVVLPTVTIPSVPTATPTPPVPSASPQDLTFKFGESAQVLDAMSGATVTVLDYKQPVAKNAPQPNEGVWGAAEVKVCPVETGEVTNEPWTLMYDDGAIVEPSSTGYDDFPTPEFPFFGRTIRGGSCVRGWITFAVPKNGTPDSVAFALPDRDVPGTDFAVAGAEPIEWLVGSSS